MDTEQTGLIDKIDQEILMLESTKRQTDCMKIELIDPRRPPLFIKDLSWLEREESIAKFLLDNIEIRFFDTGEFIIRRGERPEGIYILVTGLVRTFYEPSSHTTNLSEKYGQLPNCDYLVHLNFAVKQDDIVLPGNVFGELGLLTGEPYDYLATALAGCHVFFIATELVKQSLELQPDFRHNFESRIWKSIASHIAAMLIASQSTAALNISEQEIRQNVGRGFVPYLQDIDTIEFTELIQDMYLIQGIAYDKQLGIKYVAPCSIPPSVKFLYIPDIFYDMDMGDKLRNTRKVSYGSDLSKVKRILFIVPAKGVEESEILSFFWNDGNYPSTGIVKAVRKANIKLDEPAADRPSWLEFRRDWSEDSILRERLNHQYNTSPHPAELLRISSENFKQRMRPSISRREPGIQIDDEIIIIARKTKSRDNKEEEKERDDRREMGSPTVIEAPEQVHQTDEEEGASDNSPESVNNS